MYQIDHLYFKDSIEIATIESEAFSGSQVDEMIFDGVTVETAHDTFLLNVESDMAILKNCSIYLIPRKEDDMVVFDEKQKIIERLGLNILLHNSSKNSKSSNLKKCSKCFKRSTFLETLAIYQNFD